ncbi:polypeptide N-acetylgalactosaminyltransferase-like 6 isoform X1 [Pantherophis guttatus]|uniref:Polypeptide N-acetylgalactosaminyltransferase n=1 Tax=Pantherophis guttatus TaxID=94885 RepID=A0A6P9AG12_PANGU|nr:polypeptide N-acetylgalactosaminyltransferase-like 6 isoform X1 [Pantherophis guttatus]XP_034257245.1 polypeptide N-acetylgalactosaminyltransferase-like 6 isoform X1 [Pantherophis guttatus]XP_034257246.1 polypeptide N-acetylgalactosaminyltransferase-like 6 isoform X1 [Pantherophis guttatus]XP_034257247.1 polypeptide N-acetylgalactosaminyltransferase-like 6 isoform X1 [Pantherophis guttatus]
MKRKQKRFLQMTLLFLVTLIFLPNIGLWSLYREKHFMKSTVLGEQQTLPVRFGDGQLYTWTDGLKRKDWHDYERIQKDAVRLGKGEQGKPYPVTEEDSDDSAYRENGFNIFVSNNIALERSLPDIRHPNCKDKVYLEKLPNTSIIIPFHNEGWTSLLRTIHSIINRTPNSLIAEIILVDDFSDREHLKEKLEEYMAHTDKVRIVRTKKREGLIRTRLLGASIAKGEVLTFLDSHCEVNVNWLPPLLNQIALNHKTIVCPMIDVIDHNHFGYEAQAGDAMRGAFDWEMYYKRIPIPPELQRTDPSDPFESPVMAGGLFAINRKWFWVLGGYDPGLEIWGGEQYEISFKVWMCGGGMFDVPCSRVGHIYRKYVPYKVPSGTSLARNLKRVAETWMDEFAEYVYQRRPEYRHLSTGDISAQKELRKHLKCKDFKWFMAAVAWDVPKYFPPVEPPPASWGEIRNVAANLCMDSKHGGTGTELRLDICVKDGSERTWSHEQLFTFGWREDIRPGEPLHTRKFCFDAISHSSPVTLYDCHGMKGNQHWSYRKDKTLFHTVSGSCIDCNPAEKKIFMNRCDPLSETQQWIFEHINMTVIEKIISKETSS